MYSKKNCYILPYIISYDLNKQKEPVSVLETGNFWQVPSPCSIHRSQQDSQPA